MLRKLAVLSVLFLAIQPASVLAEWQFKQTRWVNDLHYSLFHPSIDNQGGFLLSSTNVDSIQLKLILDKNTLVSKGDSAPFIVKGKLYFDDKKFVDLSLKNSVNVHKINGEEYELSDEMFDADFYEALKNGQELRFEYQGKDSQFYKIEIPLENYYDRFNQFITYRRKELVPAYLSDGQKQQYLKVVTACIHLAENKVEDLKAKNKGVSLAERQKTVRTSSVREPYQENPTQLSQRVADAYQFFGDTSRPQWVLYQLYSECFNHHIDEIN